ncbi:MAG: methylenetetrahydrofolate reductase C-terminal domain-containing protein [Peptococcaceae bacterium]|jgi:hypothetical protein|nr:methylenetetrahydrofolate reductase C-terminal domain-containing protein [Peptococcaceae bacterium]MDH7524835.1 methylenetetrahydrofolate reductase C-terminal domain-containing protein [Peptococcaceae bacterium]
MMMISRLKPLEEMFGRLKSSESLLLLACNGCAESFGSAEPGQLNLLKSEAEQRGHHVADVVTIEFLCEEVLVRHWLRKARSKESFDAVLAVCCGVGAQVVAKVSQGAVYPACDTVSMGGRFGQPWGAELCKECGECLLPYTGGICPLTACSKGLLNGPCGGSQDGRCEFRPESRECGWQKIYRRLEERGGKELLVGPPLIKDHSRNEPPEELVVFKTQLLEGQVETL